MQNRGQPIPASSCHRLVPWYPVIPVILVPLRSGGDILGLRHLFRSLLITNDLTFLYTLSAVYSAFGFISLSPRS